MNKFSPKTAAEIIDLQIDFKQLLAPSETILAAVWKCTNLTTGLPDPSLLVAGMSRTIGSICSQRVTGGTPGDVYEVGCKITTSVSRVYEEFGTIEVTG